MKKKNAAKKRKVANPLIVFDQAICECSLSIYLTGSYGVEMEYALSSSAAYPQ